MCGQPVQPKLMRLRLSRISLARLFWEVQIVWKKRSRCAIEKRVAVVQTRQNSTVCENRSHIDGEERTNVSYCPKKMLYCCLLMSVT